MAAELSAIEMADKLIVHLSRSTDDTIRFLRVAADRLAALMAQQTAKQLRASGIVRT